MSLFGSSPPKDANPIMSNPSADHSRASLFDDEPAMTKSTSSALFVDDDNNPSGPGSGRHSPWVDLPAAPNRKSKADLVRGLLPSDDVPESYIETFEHVAEQGQVGAGGVARTLAAANLGADAQAKIMGLVVAPSENGGAIRLGRNEFNVLLALVGLAQEGEGISLDGVDERKRNLPQPKLLDLVVASSTSTRPSEIPTSPVPLLTGVNKLGAKPPQRPVTPPTPARQQASTIRNKPSMDYTDDPWNTPDVHKGHNHDSEPPARNGAAALSDTPRAANGASNGAGVYGIGADAGLHGRTTSTFTVNAGPGGESQPGSIRQSGTTVGGNSAAWAYFDGQPSSGDGFGPENFAVGGNRGIRDLSDQTVLPPGPSRTIGGSGRTGTALEETIVVGLMPEKEGMFMFQHHNYEVTSARRGSKVIRRYSDFVWLLDCLHKRYPFRTLPLLPPKRVAVNGNHLSNDGAFIEKRRRGLARFLNALIRHPVLGQEHLVIMFLTVPTELAVWRKQATISVQDEFANRALPPGLEDSLPHALEELFDRTRAGVRRSAELYIAVCNVMDRLVKRSEGVAADHARIALSLTNLTETNADTYATDTNDVPLLNDGMQAMSTHLRTAQSLMEDEARAWDEGVLEDLKRQRDALVSLRDLFDRRERLDRDNIPYLERRIQTNETKLAQLRAKPDGMVKPGEIEKAVESILKDKESIVTQHNRSIFVKETLRDELVTFQTTQYHISRWNQDWAQERVKYSEMLADNWRRLLDELDGMPLGD